MNINRRLIKSIIFAFLLVLIGGTDAYAQKDKYLIEAEAFQFKGKWSTERSAECMGSAMLRLNGGGSTSEQFDALTVIRIQEEGDYNVWVRAADYEKSPGTRLFRLSVDEKPMNESGKHGKVGFYWENVGSIQLAKKQVMLRLHDTKRNFGRCDAILLVKDHSINPNEIDRKEVGKWRKNPVKIETKGTGFDNVSAPLSLSPDAEAVATIENPNMRVSFVKAGANNQAIACRTEIKMKGVWRRFLSTVEDHKVFLITSEESPVDNDKFFPSWKNAVSKSTFTVNGKEYTVQSDDAYLNPYVAGVLSEAIPVKATNKGKNNIEVHYITKNGSTITGIWTLPSEGNHIEVSLACLPATDGMYSMGLAAFQPVPKSNMSNLLLPPMFQYKRVSPQPVMMLSSMMQQPLAIAESTTSLGGVMSSFVSGDDTTFSQEWGSVDFSPMGFSVKNEQNEVQPVAFAPVMGMKDSKVSAGQVFERKFVIGILPAGWNETIEYISDQVYKVKDYRQQKDVSLTDAMFNILDLMRNEEFGGWDAKLKGFYDIEGDPGTAPTVVHAAPLAIIAASVIADDEDFYLSRSLPTIEYTLSRSGYRWATDLVPSGYNKTLETLRLNPFKSQFNTSYYEGLHRLLGGLNPWLADIALPGDTLRKTKGYSAQVLSWVQAMSAYNLTGDEKWKRFATSTANRYIDLQIYKTTTKPIGFMAFYNTSVYAPWWDLIDLYELTKDEKYLKAAQYGAANTIAGIRSFPAVSEDLQTIHPGNRFDGNTNLWWKGKEKYRLGFPRVANDVQEKQVPEWLVSPVGLGFEQPSTYFLRTKGKQVRPVFMSNWAPHLLRLYQYTGKPIYETYARNAVIGRFTNYPGYYATGYTDITLSPDFPYKGPDVSSIYYHHIPPHLAFTWDYLVSEAIERSGGNISFPYSKQEGFVWFANRIYGNEKGKVFGDNKAKLWTKKGLIRVTNPTVNYLTAISDKYFWILLSGESQQEESVEVQLDAVAELIAQGDAVQYNEKGKTTKVGRKGNTVTLSVPGKGFRALAFPLATPQKEVSYPALKNGMEVVDMGEPFGKIFLFRIRSPFGWDSVYGFAETAPVKGKKMSVEVECNGQSCSVSSYPFEWSFYKLKLDEKAVVKVILKSEGQEDRMKEIVLNAK